MPLNGRALAKYRRSALAWPSRAEGAEVEAQRAHKPEQGHRRHRHERHGCRRGSGQGRRLGPGVLRDRRPGDFGLGGPSVPLLIPGQVRGTASCSRCSVT
ncbi:hypothetical protein [Streptomyces chrestomyceticus]|uniref:Uncharacterized protein n=1 Tax=Streptomyces chrestomyceticus TaxID=68185 RepID=A0ABU7WSZ9_9ACTN